MGNLQSNPSSSTQTIEKKYEVFLNFRGVDTRDGFTSYLYKALRAQSIETFMDDHGIPKGDVIGPDLLKAIRDSMISVVIFSNEYASSKWCLRELVEIMKSAKTVIPVFYKVSVSDVGDLKGSFMIGFDKLKKRFDEKLEKEQVNSTDVEKRKKEFDEEMQKWRQALEDASHVKGWSYENGPESKVVEEIVNDIWEKLMRAHKLSLCDFKGLFGFEKRFKQVMSLLSLDDTDVRIIGIWGMGGIGKTTIAKAIFHQIFDNEYGKCFIHNVRQRLEGCGGLVSVLQEEVLSKVLNDQDIRLDGVTLPKYIKGRLCQKKVFIVLDDVDDFFKLEDLATDLDRLADGSRIIITTRNRDILHNCEVNNDCIYEVKGLPDEEADKLFCKYAFGQSPPNEDLMELSQKTLRAIDGNPLALKVVGSSLLRSNKLEWQSALSKLKKSRKILEVLQISYDGLPAPEHQITFLDIACFFVGEHEDYVIEILDNCSYSLKVLSDRSLITISDDKIIQMHDLLQEMGREIVCKESLNNAGKRSRLWIQEDILDTLKNVAGTNKIEGIFLNMSQINEEHLSSQAFEKMTNLKFLKFYDSTFHDHWFIRLRYEAYCSSLHFSNGISYLSNKLRSLNWLGYPLEALPSNFNPKYLVELHLTDSNIEKLWKKNTSAPKLKRIFLMHCPYLIQVLDLLYAPELENISIIDCESLLGLGSVKEFQSLKYLCPSTCDKLTWIPDLNAPLPEMIYNDECKNLLGFPSPAHPFNNLRMMKMRFCDNLQSFPNEIHFPSLISLDLSQCTNLARISDILDAPSLQMINLNGCGNLLDFPRPAQHFNKLHKINLEGCSSLLYFPAPSPHCNNLYNIHFPSLNCLDFYRCIKLKVFPCISGNIEMLYMRKTAIHEVPSSVENLTELVELDLENCTSLKHISSNIHKLKALRELNLRNCSALECFPEILHIMGSLEILNLRGTAIKGLHRSIENLSGLKVLILSKCKNLDEVPPSIEKLTELLELDLSECTSLKHISINICNMKALRRLYLTHCSALVCFPEILDTTESLEALALTGTAIKGLHHSIDKLTSIKYLCLSGCKNLEMLPISIYNLTSLVQLDLSCCRKLENLLGNSLTDLSNYGESATTKPPICKLSNCELRFANCPNLSKTAINIMELQINQHRDMTIKGCGTQAVNLKLFYPESEVPGWFKRQTNGSSINIQMLSHDGVNGHLIGLAACAVIEFCDADEGNDDEGYDEEGFDDDSYDQDSDDEIYDKNSLVTIRYSHSCHCEDKSRLLKSFGIYHCIYFILDPHEDANPDHVVLWYSNAFVSELCGKCTDYLFKFSIEEEESNCRVKHCGVCPIYEKHNIILPSIANWTCGAIDQDFGKTSFKEQGKVRKFSDEAETSGRSNEDVIEPHPKRNCS